MNNLIIGIAGGSGSGKTTLACRLKALFGEDEVRLISHDSYYKRHDELPFEERCKLNYDHPDAFDNALLIYHLQELKAGRAIDCPVYDYADHNRSNEVQHIEPAPVLIVEGILPFVEPELCAMFDYKIFDEYVELAMECGIDEAITLYTPIPWGFRHRYKDEATGDYSYINWAPSSEEFKKMWNIFLTDFKFHLEAKSWLDITYIGINENPMEETLAAINVVRNHDKCWKITYAGNWHKELDGLLDDYSFLYGEEPTIAEQKARAATGRTSTVYVCCNPPIPNNFVFSPPIEGRWISWYVMAYGYDGFLRWAYDAWPEDADRDARHGSWAAGDCYMVYPGGKSCIRFEKMREGIVDFEKVRILRELTAQSGNAQAQGLLKQLDQHLSIFPKEKEFDENKISADVRKGNLIIRQLSDLLAK